MKPIKYHYFVVAGYTVTLATSALTTTYAVGAAFCSPSDKFCKRTGRLLAEKRLIDNGSATFSKKPMQQLLEYIINVDNVPEKVKDAVLDRVQYVLEPRRRFLEDERWMAQQWAK